MVRKAALALFGLALAAAAGLTGCTWAETQHDYSPSMLQAGGHGHAHGHGDH